MINKIIVRSVIFIFLMLSISFVFCKKDIIKSDNATIVLKPIGNRMLYQISIKKEGSSKNFANETTIYSSTSYSVDPGDYSIFFRYKNLDNNISGVNVPDIGYVGKGEEWVIEYGYYGSDVYKKD